MLDSPFHEKHFPNILNLNLLWHNLREFSLVLSLVTWDKGLTHKLLPGSCRQQQGNNKALSPFCSWCFAQTRRCWPTSARNNQQAPGASQGSSHTLQDSGIVLFLYIKASVLGSSNFTPLFLFHSLLQETEKLGIRKETK